MKKKSIVFLCLLCLFDLSLLLAQNTEESDECTKITSPALIIMPNNSIMVQWNASNMADSFYVISDTIGKIPADCGIRYSTQNHEQTFSNLFSKQTYQFLVRSNCGIDFSDWRWFFVNYRSSIDVEALPLSQISMDSIGFIYANDSNTYAYKYLDLSIDTEAVSTYIDFAFKSQNLADTLNVSLFLLSPYSAIEIDNSLNNNYQIGSVCLAGNTEWQHQHIELGQEFSGSVNRLLFVWKNIDGTIIDLPLLIDSLSIASRFCAIPDSLRTTALSSHSAQITWLSAYGQENFQLEYKKDIDTEWIVYQNIENNFELENLLPDTYYNVRVKALCDDEESLYSESFTFKTLIDLSTPENISLNIGDTFVFLSWSQVTNANAYLLAYKEESESNWRDTLLEQNSVFLDSLLPNTSYDLRIKALYNDVESLWSEVINFKTKCKANNSYPYIIEQEFFADISNSNLPLCWLYDSAIYSMDFDLTLLEHPYLSFEYKSSNAIEIQISTNGGESFVLIDNLLPVATYSSRLFSLSDYSGYEKVVLRFSSENISDFRVKNFVLQNACPTVSNVVVNDISQTSFTLVWQDGGMPVRLTLQDNSGDIIHSTTTQNNTYTFTNLQPNSIYSVVLSSVCESLPLLDSIKIEVQTLAIEYVCPVPTNFQGEWVHSDIDEALLVTWESEANIWQVVYKDYYAVNWDTTIVTLNSVFTLRNLELNHTYLVKVRAICNVGDTSDFTELIQVNIGNSDLEDIQSTEKDITIYPNPTTNAIKIKSKVETLSSIAIYKSDG
ncbi:MAG: fibronectin type III domain-containing protein, partial [Bacteroidota bacterium]|nr:fibronectin type III domain-containing protein [Bacteroidota bacterium]